MNAQDVIELYVTDVAKLLPRKQRNDVAFELRALLAEELQAKAEGAGRDADAAIAIELVQAFGRPSEVAARYRPSLTIIDPEDGHTFLRASVIGLLIIWFLGLFVRFRDPSASEVGFLNVLGAWWMGTVIPSLWWPGVLVVGFGIASWVKRRRPRPSDWMPRPSDRIQGGRSALVLGIVGILCGAFVLIDPRWILDAVFGGRAAPAAYEALTYTETFRNRQAPLLLALILLYVPILGTVIVNGRWSALLRRIETGLALATSAALLWTALDGPVFLAPASDRTTKFLLVLIAAFTLISLVIGQVRRVRPTPDQRLRA